MKRCFITGATGFVGSHVAEACVQKGIQAVTVARAQSDTRLLEQWGVEIVRGDLTDPNAVAQAMAGADAVVHCAAKVGDWGPVEEYREVNVGGTALLLEEARKHKPRFVHVSSLGVYAARDHDRTDESEPPPDSHMDGYTQTKVESEKLVLSYHQHQGVPVVVLRPGFIYGPRDRTVLPRLMNLMAQGQIRYIGSKTKLMNAIYVGNLVDAIFLALERSDAVGQVFNLTDDEDVTKERFMETIADLAGLPKPTKVVPLPVARMLARLLEGIARLRGAKQAPRVTQARIKFMGLNLSFSCEKAKRDLGYQPAVRFADGMKRTIDWWKEEQARGR
ncbi:MAG TPA: NAD-dependent epimerase/dehydratase family protein [Gemmatales bacterium]|nr:NAD-dependent epimerase/dehydratase family protein [Gemmatales bacterium]HMP58845.1 NAD-dependent epimerase/dehydratase family protein [Gemmatales bacterium]